MVDKNKQIEELIHKVIEAWIDSTEQAKGSLQSICEEKIRTTMVSILAYIEEAEANNQKVRFNDLRNYIFDTGNFHINALKSQFQHFNVGFKDKQILPIKPLRKRNYE